MSWPLVKLGYVFEISSSKRVLQKDWKKNGVPFYRAREVAVLSREGKVDNELFIDEKMYEEYKLKFGVPKKGDLLVTAVGTLGVTYIVKESDKFYFKDASVILLSPKVEVDISYIQHAMNSPIVQRFIQNSNGATVGTYTISRARETEIPLPPLAEQKRIAAILDKADAIRQKRQQAINLADDFLRSVFLDMFGDPVTNPKGWEVKPLQQLIKIQGGYAFKSADFSETGIPVVKIGNANKLGFTTKNIAFIEPENTQRLKQYELYCGDLLMSLTGTVGKDDYANITEVTDEFDMYYLNQRVAKITVDQSQVSKNYLKCFLAHPRIKSEITKNNRGVRQANIGNSDIYCIQMPVPDKEFLDKFDSIICMLTSINSKSKLMPLESEKLFNSLSQKAFAGEL